MGARPPPSPCTEGCRSSCSGSAGHREWGASGWCGADGNSRSAAGLGFSAGGARPAACDRQQPAPAAPPPCARTAPRRHAPAAPCAVAARRRAVAGRKCDWRVWPAAGAALLPRLALPRPVRPPASPAGPARRGPGAGKMLPLSIKDDEYKPPKLNLLRKVSGWFR